MSWRLFKNVPVLLLFAALIIAYDFFDISCPFYKLTSIPCPSCKMTSALIALSKGDVASYIEYNIMALPVAIAITGELFINLSGKWKKIFHISAIIILSINFIYYLFRLGKYFFGLL